MNLHARLIAAALFVVAALLTPGTHIPRAGAQGQPPGRLISSTGGTAGGIVEFNTDGSNVVNMTANSFDTSCVDGNAYKDYHATVSRDGRLVAFQSRGDARGVSRERIFVMNGDGTDVRQLTFDAPSGDFQAGTVRDINPVISPDGTRVAFVSNRTVDSTGRCGTTRFDDIYVVNTDGTGLRRVTNPQPTPQGMNGACGGSIASVVWNADGTRLAFRGVRRAVRDNNPGFYFVVGTINENGTSEAILDIFLTTGQSSALDWSPSGRYIGMIWGNEAQDAPAERINIYDLQAGGNTSLFPSGFYGSGPGNFRFSPDSQRFVISTVTGTFGDPPRVTFMNLDGSGRTDVPVPSMPQNEPLWWQAGATVPTPSRLELIPNPLVARAGGPNTQMLPTLYDAQNNVIVRAATAWRLNRCSGGTARITHFGLITPGTETASRTDQACASNGGLSACADMFVNPATNKIDEPNVFVREHYSDFLNRAGDESGVNFWTGGITSCGSNQGCVDVKRVNTSAAFFLSIEFQETGYLVERMYKAAYGDVTGNSTFPNSHTLAVPVIRLNEFLPDTQRIGQGVVVGQGDWQTQLENNKQAFALEFVQRVRFISAYPTTRTPAQYVDALFANAGVTPSATERNAAIGEFGSAANTTDQAARARALRDVAQNTAFTQAEFNHAFVLMQYFGYLRRNPNDAPDADYTGYDFWLQKLNQFQGNFVQAEMVKAFLSSTEYRGRFGQP